MSHKSSIEGVRDPRPVTNIQLAIADLRSARDRLRFAGADRAADYVARALKSAEGALRHAQGLVVREAVQS